MSRALLVVVLIVMVATACNGTASVGEVIGIALRGHNAVWTTTGTGP